MEYPRALLSFTTIVHVLYVGEVLEEDTILHWFPSDIMVLFDWGTSSFRYDHHECATSELKGKIHVQVTTFYCTLCGQNINVLQVQKLIDWLRTASEEEDDSDSDSD